MDFQNIDPQTFNDVVQKELQDMVDSQAGTTFKVPIIDRSLTFLLDKYQDFSGTHIVHMVSVGSSGGRQEHEMEAPWNLETAIKEWWNRWGSNVEYHFKERYWSDEVLKDILKWKDQELADWSIWLTKFADRWKAEKNRDASKTLIQEWKDWSGEKYRKWREWYRRQEERWEKERREQILYEHAVWLQEMMILDSGNPHWKKYGETVERKKEEIGIANRMLLRLQKDKVGIKYAEGLLHKSDLLKYLCPALKTVSNDSFEVAKIITPIMIGLAVAGTISIPALPIVFASTAYVLTRMGVSTLCRDYPTKTEEHK